MQDKNQLLRRLIALLCMLLLCCGIAGGQLASLQLVNGEQYVKQAAVNLTTSSTVSAARGEILDRYGRPLVTNRSVFSLVLVYSAWEKEGQFERLLDLASKVRADGGTLCDILPVTETAPYGYVGGAGDASRKALSAYLKDSRDTLGLQKVITAVENAKTDTEVDAIDATALVAPTEFINAMRSYLGFPESFSAEDARTVVGLYYSMRTVGFSMRQSFTLATDISIDLISVLKENHRDYQGVEIETEAGREYDTTYGAHLIGTVGPMYAEDWNGRGGEKGYSSKAGYNMNDTIGKSGIEYAMEGYLHGAAGSRTVETSLGGDTVNEQTTSYAPQPGDNVILTIDLDLQKAAEQSLAENVAQYGAGGAAVALDVNSGEVLAMASYPTFDLQNFNQDYDAIAADSRSPQLNRATSGVYAPGSTFKILTAIAALEEGVIDEKTTYNCPGYFEYGGQRFECNNKSGHGTVDVTSAIKYSCNVFFYEVGKTLTGERLEKWCDRFGLGNVTGIEIGDSKGQAAGPVTREKMLENDPSLRQWQGGDDVQAAIGQSDNWFTPLQLANYLAAVVNGGTLYKPSLIKTVKSYNYGETVLAEKPEVKNTIEFSKKARDLVMTGMGEVTAEGGTAATVFANYPIKVGGKTGTAETNVEGRDNGVFIAFAPFDNPQIAICVVGEGAHHGSSVAPVVRDMFDAYFSSDGNEDKPETVQPENTLIS